MRAMKAFGIAAAVLVAAILVYQLFLNKEQTTEPPVTAQQQPAAAPAEKSASDTESTDADSDVAELSTPDVAQTDDLEAPADNQNAQANLNYPPLASYEIGNEPITDEALAELIKRLNNDPVLMAELINDLRGETDPVRLKRLVYILGATENAAVLPAAEEMIYSGIPSSRDVGLDLLSRVATYNSEAYEVAGNILVSETDPQVLVATMNVMAQPGDASPELAESLVTQITTLSTHESAAVRGFSVTTLARLTKNPDMTPLFQNALYDSEPGVRSSAVYAFASFPYHTAEISQKLLDMVEDEYENPEVRRGALLALSNNSPDPAVKKRLDAVESAMVQQARKNRRNRNQ